jgi:hypothetical protein
MHLSSKEYVGVKLLCILEKSSAVSPGKVHLEHHILEVTPVTLPVWGANDRLIGRQSSQADQRTQKAKTKPQALPELILVVIIHQIAKRLLMSQVDQMN